MNAEMKSITSVTPYSCKRCLYTTHHPLGLTLDEGGVCSGCRIHEEKGSLDWERRWKKLQDLVLPYRVSNGKTYDCIVPVTGANDSYYVVYVVKELLGLNPLLVTYNKYFNTQLGIRNLANLRIRFNCDIIYQNVNPISVKKITRSTLRDLGSIYWPCLAGQTVFPVQTAVRYRVPLIVWGAHQGIEQVGMFSHEQEVEMSRRYRKDHDLMGFEADDLLSIFDTLTEDDVWQYRYPDDASLHSVGVRGIYLGNYLRWDPKAQHQKMVQRYSYQGAHLSRTFDTYDHVDCYSYMDLHDYLKYLKHGYSKVTDHACREIRHGRLTRERAAVVVRRYSAQPLRHLGKFCDWLGINQQSLKFLANQHINPERFFPANGKPQELLQTNSKEKLIVYQEPGFQSHAELDRSEGSHYVTIGKGYP